MLVSYPKVVEADSNFQDEHKRNELKRHKTMLDWFNFNRNCFFCSTRVAKKYRDEVEEVTFYYEI